MSSVQGFAPWTLDRFVEAMTLQYPDDEERAEVLALYVDAVTMLLSEHGAAEVLWYLRQATRLARQHRRSKNQLRP